jgi:hypothetical protein
MSTGFQQLRRISWEVPQCPFHIEVAVSVIDDIRLAVVEGFFSVPRGGVEIGGVLFGDRQTHRIVIHSFRRIECEYKSGPSFILSARDRARLAQLLGDSQTDPELAGQQCLGWFHSHTRSEICLTPADLEIYGDYFPGPQDVTLVLKPAQLQPTMAGFFFREPDGSVRAESSYQEFSTDPAFLKSFVSEDIVSPPPFREVGAVRKPALLPVLAFLLLGITLGTALVAFWPSLPPPIGLEAVEVNDAIVLRWNRQSPTVQHASGGVLEITDGSEKLSQPLAVRDIQLGLATYHRRTDHAEFKLTVEQPNEKAVAESVVVTGPVPGTPVR